MSNKPVILVTAADLAPQAVDLLNAYELVFAGRAPQDDEIVGLAKKHNPVGIIVRYGRVTAETMDAAPNLKVISKHGSGIDTIDQAAAQSRSITVVAALGVNAAAVAEQALALPERDRKYLEPEFVNQVICKQRLHQIAAAVDLQHRSLLLLELFELLDNVIAKELGVFPR